MVYLLSRLYAVTSVRYDDYFFRLHI